MFVCCFIYIYIYICNECIPHHNNINIKQGQIKVNIIKRAVDYNNNDDDDYEGEDEDEDLDDGTF